MAATETINAIAIARGDSQSPETSGNYTILPPAIAPVFSPGPGTYIANQSVTITSATPGAVIYYTTNGAAPTQSSTQYSGPIAISSTQTIVAIAVSSGYWASAPVTATYRLTPPAAVPAFTPTPGTSISSQVVTISDGTPGAIVYYTTNGTAATAASTQYTGPITVSATETINAMATAPGFSASPAASATYTITPPAATPTYSVSSGTYITTQTITLKDATPGATIYYTTDGSTPTTSSTSYATPITVPSTGTINALATAPGYSQSAMASATYTITPPAAKPVFSPAAGTYISNQTVSISDSAPGSTIYYTTDGSAPTIGSTEYTAELRFHRPRESMPLPWLRVSRNR